MHKNEHIKALKMNYKNLIFGNCVHKMYWRCIGMELNLYITKMELAPKLEVWKNQWILHF